MTGTQYIHDGNQWVAANTPPPPPSPDVQNFTTSGTWIKPAGARVVAVQLLGAGSASAIANNTGPTGSGGAFFAFTFDAADLGATESVTVGAGGASAGADGGDSIFKGLIGEGGQCTNPQNAYGFPLPGKSYYKKSATIYRWALPAGSSSASEGISTYSSGGAGNYGAGKGGSSQFGGGGGQGGKGGLGTAAYDVIVAGDGGSNSAGAVPGGGGGNSSTAWYGGARGEVRITTFF